jgi:putative transposase
MNSENYTTIDGTVYVSWNALVTHKLISKGTLDASVNRKSKSWHIIVDPEDKRCRLIDFNCKAIQKYKPAIIAKFGDPNAQNNPLDNLQEGPNPLDKYTEKEIRETMAQYSLVMHYRQDTANAPKGKLTTAKREWANLVSLGLLHKYESDILGGKVSFPSLERWDKLMRDGKNTMDDLLPDKSENQVTDSLTKEQKDLLLDIALGKNQLKIAQAVKMALTAWRISGVSPLPSESRCARYLTEYKKNNFDRWTYRRMGEKALTDLALPSISRDEESVQFMDLWVADGHTCNFMIANPVTGKLCRPTLIVWFDFATRIPVGYELMYTENTKAVLSAFRNGCLWIGNLLGIEGGILPRAVYMDNGKAFKNRFFINIADFDNQIMGLFGRLQPFGLEEIMFAWPYNARSKPVERFFVDFDAVERRFPTYTGQNALAKPADMNRNEPWHKGQLKKHINKYGYPTLQGAFTIIREWVENDYILTASASKYLAGQAPLQKAESQAGIINIENRSLAPDHFNYMLMHEKRCTLSKEGFIIDGVVYFNAKEFPGRIKGKEGYDYIVKYDILFPEKVWVYYAETGKLWCTAKKAIWNKVHAAAPLGSQADREHLGEAIEAIRSIKKESMRAAKAAGNGVSMEFSQLPEHETVALPEKQKALTQKQKALPLQSFSDETEEDNRLWDIPGFGLIDPFKTN